MASAKYKSILKSIQTGTAKLTDKVNLEQPIITIDLDDRTVTLPKAYRNYLAIQNDHVADSVYFCMDRYFDAVDLSKRTLVVEYVNAAKEFRVAPIYDIDVTTDPSKIYFAWKVAHGATKQDGKIQFAVRVYELDPNTDEFVYNLSTSPQTATILKGLASNAGQMEEEGNGDLTIDEKLKILDKIRQLEQKAVRWADLT